MQYYWLIAPLLLCSFLSAAAQQQCQKKICSSVGGVCDLATFSNLKPNRECSPELWCSTDSGTSGNCTAGKLKLNEACDYNYLGYVAQCQDGLSCDHVSRVCFPSDFPGSYTNTAAYRILPGDVCNRFEQCEYNEYISSSSFRNEQLCINGQCKHVPLGGECKTPIRPLRYQCIRGTYCSHDNYTCVPALPDMAECENSPECQSNFCLDKVCVGVGSQKIGGKCHANYQCQEGYYCSKNAPYAMGTMDTYGVCKQVIITPTMNQPCNKSSICAWSNGETCACTGSGLSVCSRPHNAHGLFAAEKDLIACAAKHCGSIYRNAYYDRIVVSRKIYTQNACIIRNCNQEMNALYTKEVEGDRTIHDCMLPPGEVPAHEDEYFPTSEIPTKPPFHPPTRQPSPPNDDERPPYQFPTYPPYHPRPSTFPTYTPQPPTPTSTTTTYQDPIIFYTYTLRIVVIVIVCILVAYFAKQRNAQAIDYTRWIPPQVPA